MPLENAAKVLTSRPIACSACFADRGLRLDAERIGIETTVPCPNCGTTDGRKLIHKSLEELAFHFFVWGSLRRWRYGAAPLIQFNEHQKTTIDAPPWLVPDVELFERLLGVGFFHYGPRLWMLGQIEPLQAIQKSRTRQGVIDRILCEYPTKIIGSEDSFYRIRKGPTAPADPSHYDSPPESRPRIGRLDSPRFPVLYASPDLELCVHECRVAAEDDLYVATLAPKMSLRLLNLSVLLNEENVTEFESLDMTVHMLFLAGKHAYRITREIATAARARGFDGMIYPSYFSLLRLGAMPFQTVYGISHRRIPQFRAYEQEKSLPNLAIFGRPIEQGKLTVKGINKLIMTRVEYNFLFGPLAF